MNELKRLTKLVDDVWELIFGTSRNTKSSTSDWVEPDNHDFSYPITDYAKEKYKKMATTKKPKRARTKKGTYRADDKSTAFTNEAWVGGMSPKERKALDKAMRKATKLRDKTDG